MSQRELNDICIIAKQAGLILREGYEKHHDIKSKGRQDDLVTEMDKKSENFILDRLNALYPEIWSSQKRPVSIPGTRITYGTSTRWTEP